MHIVIDIDNVICDFVSAMIDFLNQKYNTNYKSEDVVVWDFVESPNIDLSYDDFLQSLDEFYKSGKWLKAPLYPDSKEVLDWLHQNHHIIYLTNRPPASVNLTQNYFLSNQLPFTGTHTLLSYNDIVTKGNIVFANQHTKAEYVKKLGMDIVIEDKPSSVQEYLDSGVKTVLKEEPYNCWVKYKDPNRLLYRCKNLSKFKRLIEKLTKGEEGGS